MTWEKREGDQIKQNREVWLTPKCWMRRVQGHCKSDQMQCLSFLLPWSGDKWRQLFRFRNREVPSTAPCRSVFVLHAVSCLISDYLFFLFMLSSQRSKLPLFWVFKILFRKSKAVVNMWTAELPLFYTQDLLCSCYSLVWKRTQMNVFILVKFRQGEKRHSYISGHWLDLAVIKAALKSKTNQLFTFLSLFCFHAVTASSCPFSLFLFLIYLNID